jgi:4-aminobutyrate aminotransferase/(S)-3-amino-2-methylpropionate transaminase
VVDVDGNRYVDLAAGFGALLLGHGHPAISQALHGQAGRLWQALGDVHPADVKVALLERLAQLVGHPGALGILGQSGADAVSAALKTAMLATGKPGVIAFRGAYHGLSYGPLAACGLRSGYREPFAVQLNPEVHFVDYPDDADRAVGALAAVKRELLGGRVGAVLVEPILGRGGCIVPPDDFMPELVHLARSAGALVVADEIWTGLGRAGRWLYSSSDRVAADLICLGKGLGGGLPISACVGTAAVMRAWCREPEVVHTSTFAGAPLACATALATLDQIERDGLIERSARLGEEWRRELARRLERHGGVTVRGAGLMLGVDLGQHGVSAAQVAQALLGRGFITSTGGGGREVLVLTPALTVTEAQLEAFNVQLADLLDTGGRA